MQGACRLRGVPLRSSAWWPDGLRSRGTPLRRHPCSMDRFALFYERRGRNGLQRFALDPAAPPGSEVLAALLGTVPNNLP
jgi:hypothetical protein